MEGLPRIGQLVYSRAGRDRGSALVVVGIQDARHVLVSDGDLRPGRRPKLKSARHLGAGLAVHPGVAAGHAVPDAEIRAWIRAVTAGADPAAPGGAGPGGDLG